MTLRSDLTALGRRFGLSANQIERLRRLLHLLESDPQAPTTVRGPAAAAAIHLADSLVALELPAFPEAGRAADLGAGAGFPGLALAVARPRLEVSLVESSRRKCVFLERAVGAAGAANATVVCARAEEWNAGLDACDLVTARALAPLEVVVEYASPLLRGEGMLVAWKGRRDPDEERRGAAAAQQIGLEPGPVVSVSPYRESRRRHLHVYRKVAAAPPGFPRRPGMARKRPLGAASVDLH